MAEGAVLTDEQKIHRAAKAIDDGGEALASLIRKQPEVVERWIQFAVEKFSDAERALTYQKACLQQEERSNAEKQNQIEKLQNDILNMFNLRSLR